MDLKDVQKSAQFVEYFVDPEFCKRLSKSQSCPCREVNCQSFFRLYDAILHAGKIGSGYVVALHGGKRTIIYWLGKIYSTKKLPRKQFFEETLNIYPNEDHFLVTLENSKITAIPNSRCDFVRISGSDITRMMLDEQSKKYK